MIKIRPTNRLPYVKVVIPANRQQSIENTTNALSTVAPEKMHIDYQALGLLHNAAAYSAHLKGTTGGPHLLSIQTAWKNRKTP